MPISKRRVAVVVVGVAALVGAFSPAAAHAAAPPDVTVTFPGSSTVLGTTIDDGFLPVGLPDHFDLVFTNAGSSSFTFATTTSGDFPISDEGAGLTVLASTVPPGTTSCLGATIATGQSCEVAVTVIAKTYGKRSATVELGDNLVETVSVTGFEYYYLADQAGAAAYFDTNGVNPSTGEPDFVDGHDRVLNRPVVTVAATQDALGYYEAASDGGIFTFGDAAFYGSTGGRVLNQPIVGMAPHQTLSLFEAGTGGVDGYYEVASDGGVFAFGPGATFYGSTGSERLNAPIVGMALTNDERGYWLVASDGGIFAFGDARFYGSEGGQHLNQPIVGMATTPDGGGYYLVASDGGIFTFGDATFHGSQGGHPLNQPIIGMAVTPDGGGYWMTARDGGSFTFGDAPYIQDGLLATAPDIVAISPTNVGVILNEVAPAGLAAGGRSAARGMTGTGRSR